MTTTVQSKNADHILSYGLYAPTAIPACSNCMGGETKNLGYFPEGTSLVFSMTDVSCGMTFLSSLSNHASIDQLDDNSWSIRWDDGGGLCGFPDGDLNDMITLSVIANVPHSLKVTLLDGPEPTVEGNVATTSIRPSFVTCAGSRTAIRKRKLKVECVNKNTGDAVEGCQLGSRLEFGPNNGGHNHHSDSRPLGKVTPESVLTSPIEIPVTGLEFTYEAPEVAGSADLRFFGIDANGKELGSTIVRFEVKVEGLVPLENDGLYFDVKSHPGNGNMGTTQIKERLAILVTTFRKQVTAKGIVPPKLESEGASLPWGGVLDFAHNDAENPRVWTPPHCLHREGDIIDISFSSFDGYDPRTRAILTSALEEAFTAARLKARVHNNNHWHALTE